MFPALYYTREDGSSLRCRLCPHHCLLEEGQYGKCQTRVNRNGKLFTESYGILSSISTDPIEKKPLYHFYPGSSILSIGSFGCNMSCDFCQNCEISQINHRIFSHHPARDPDDIVAKALLHRGNIGLAYTYNEPTIYYEYMFHCAVKAREQKLKNVMVTNGYISRIPLDDLLPYMDAFNVDLKSFRNSFYRQRTGTTLKPVLDTIERIAASDSHLELTFLIIPGLNDSEGEWEEMIRWIERTCGGETVLHVSRYFPRHKLNNPPTSLKTIQKFLELSEGKLSYVYPGNTPRLDSDTYCPNCGKKLIERNMYHTSAGGIDSDGRCNRCSHRITGSFNQRV